jgi:hypothetical protein
VRSFDEAKFSFKAGSGLEIDSVLFDESAAFCEIDFLLGFNGGQSGQEQAIEEYVNFLQGDPSLFMDGN